MELDFKEATNSFIPKFFIKKIANFEHIVIFGAGESGEWCYQLFKKNGIEVSCFIDNYKLKQGTEKNGKLIYSFTEALLLYPDAAICVASMWQEEIIKQIEDYDKKLLTRTFLVLNSMAWETADKKYESNEILYIKKNLKKFEELYESLGDEASKKTLIGILNYRLTRKIEYLKQIRTKEMTYFDKTLITNKAFNGIIVDAGAFDGDTVQALVSTVEVTHALNIISIEPERKNILQFLKRSFPTQHKISLLQKALSDKSGDIIYINSQGLSSKVSEKNNGEAVETIALDDLDLKNISFIKMDIEGAERFALLGGAKTIKKQTPTLAICAYHLQDDLLVLSKTIKKINKNYKIFLRHYMESAGDTILYAIAD